MRRLILARHARSDWRDPSLTDHQRPLNARGLRDAARVGEELAGLGLLPDAVYCSTAARTRETWERMEPFLAERARVEFARGLYLASVGTVIGTAASAPREAWTVMVVGHNPSMHAAAAALARSGDPIRRALLAVKFPTGAAAVLELAGDDWADAALGGTLERFVLPKELG